MFFITEESKETFSGSSKRTAIILQIYFALT